MKVYVLEIGYDSKKDKIEYIKEYIDNAKAIVHINDEEIELDEELSDCIETDIVGIS
jgi:hypothetical protein|tara:strand:- start:790 stop:960 length:171 start_codon:yes stop_codon:yes gene_type:complete